MANYKIKLAVATMILSACVAAQPVAANAEEPDAALPPETAPQGQESAGEEEKQQPDAVAVLPSSDVTTEEETIEEETTEVEDTDEETTEGNTTEVETAEEEISDEDTTKVETSEEDTNEEKTTDEDTAEVEDTDEETTEGDTTGAEVADGETTEGNTTKVETSEEDTNEETTTEEDITEGENTEEGAADEDTTKVETPEDGTTKEEPSEEDVLEENAPVPANQMRAPADPNDEISVTATEGEEDTEEDNSVAYITTTKEDGTEEKTSYNTFDEAVKEAKDGDTIVLTKDTETAGLNLSKNLTVQGTITKNIVTRIDDDGNETEEIVEKKTKLTFADKGIALWGKNLTFKDMEVEMTDVGSTPYTAEWNWMAICASKDASLTLDNTDMTMDGTGAGNAHAIYFCSNNKLNIQNGSTLIIRDYAQDALEWDGGDGGYNVNIADSTFISDHNRSGFTGTFYATIDNSKVEVINSTGNGSNGSHFIITNESVVDFNDNGSHGLSTGILVIDHSTVTANGNGANGIHTNNTMTINESTVTVEDNDCSISSKWTIPGAIHVGAGASTITNSTVTIRDNRGSGIYQKAPTGSLTITGGKVTIVGNAANKLGLGGGIYVNGTVALDAKTIINNNHASVAGDDIFIQAGGTLKLLKSNATGTNKDNKELLYDSVCVSDTKLGDLIDGWYIDAEGARWDFHGEKNNVINLDQEISNGNSIEKKDDGSYHISKADKGAEDTGALLVKTLVESVDSFTVVRDSDNAYHIEGIDGVKIVKNEDGSYDISGVTILKDQNGFYLVKGVSILKNGDGSYEIKVASTVPGGFALKAAHAEPAPQDNIDDGDDGHGSDPDPVIPVTPVTPETPEEPEIIEIVTEAPSQPEEAAPQVKLPQTGQNWALAGLLGAVGTLLASAGFASGKHSKRRKDEHEA